MDADLQRIEAKLDRLLALFAGGDPAGDDDGAAFVRSLAGKTTDEMIALNRARNKRLAARKGVEKTKTGRSKWNGTSV